MYLGPRGRMNDVREGLVGGGGWEVGEGVLGGEVTIYKDRALRIHSLKSQDRPPIELLGFRNEINQDNK